LPAYGPEDFARDTGVSRETLARLVAYAELLEKWQKTINLVSARTLPDLWRRHMLDSAQLAPLLPDGAKRLLDLGSGAGFPGLVLAVMTGIETHLIESDARKCAFLVEAARVTGAPVRVHAARIEAVDPAAIGPVDAITARAFAPLAGLLAHAAPFCTQDTVILSLKGQHVDNELTEATIYWSMDIERHPSATSVDGVVLRLGNLAKT
jgi:16S rRNA (guanine527-N7)-methyltransferase